jgi:hypothetical protein
VESISAVQKKYGSKAMTTAIILCLVCILVGEKAIGKGLLLGTLFSVINFVLMAATLPMRLNQSKRRAFWISLGSLLARYSLLAVPLVVALKVQGIHPVSTACGLFMIQIVILFDNLFGNLALTRKNTWQG